MLTIRNVHHKDRVGIAQLIDALNRGDHLGYSLTEQWFDYVIQDAAEDIFVAIYRDKLVGLATCMINQLDISQANINIVVDPQHRNKGLGSSLYKRVMGHAQSKNLQQLEAYVKERITDAIAFVHKRGFQEVLYSWHMEIEVEQLDSINIEKKGIIFRIATGNDGKEYAEIIRQSFGDVLGEDSLEQVFKDPSIQVYLIERDGEAIGTATMQTRTTLSVGYIYDVAVKKSHQGQGLGGYMLDKCLRKLKVSKIKKASLLVTGENKSALALYHKLGFKEVDTDIIISKYL